MPDREQLKIIQKGKNTWNKWRRKNPTIKIDLSKADLSKADLSEADLSGADLSRADLSEADLYRADLSRANLYRADLSRANLYRAYLSEADLYRADLYRAYLSRANLYRADLYRANLSRAQAQNTIFDKANLTGSCIEEWNINNQTNLNNICCDYVYLKRKFNKQTHKYYFSERRPSNLNKNFQKGEFRTYALTEYSRPLGR